MPVTPGKISVSNIKMDDALRQIRAINLRELEQKIQTLHDADELDDEELLELQQAMQQHAQMIQTFSNIMKAQNDTLKGLIQNMR